MNSKLLFQQAIDHRSAHECSAYPYEEGDRLVAAIRQYQPASILEIGTGVGYTATIMAQADPEAKIITIEKDPEHALLAKRFFTDNDVANQITLINEPAELYLPRLKQQVDFIFFDGFQIHYQFIIEYEKLLRSGGILFLGNNHLKSRTSDMFFEDLEDESNWQIIEKFAETTVAKRV